jgi:hypothetical protein
MPESTFWILIYGPTIFASMVDLSGDQFCGFNRYGSVDATTLCCLRRIVLHAYIFCVVLVLSFFSSKLSADLKKLKGKNTITLSRTYRVPTCIIYPGLKKNCEPTDPRSQTNADLCGSGLGY